MKSSTGDLDHIKVKPKLFNCLKFILSQLVSSFLFNWLILDI